MHLLLTDRPWLRIELTDEDPFSKCGEPVLRVSRGQDVKEYYSPNEEIAYGITAGDYLRVACRNNGGAIIERFWKGKNETEDELNERSFRPQLTSPSE